jgi:CRP-like cAMP-binding protein
MTQAHQSSQLPPKANRLLAALPQADYERLLPHLRPVVLPLGEVVYESGDTIHTVYFMTAGLISLVLTSNQGVNVEVGIVAREGLVGMKALVSNGPVIERAVVQISGSAYRMSAETLREEFEHSSILRNQILRHTQAMFTQSAQCALCNRLHTIEERLSRWLLTVSDRIGSDELELTQEFLAHMLGSRRTGVTVACGILRTAGLIRYQRGHIKILNREEMKDCACECYGVIHDEFERLFH